MRRTRSLALLYVTLGSALAANAYAGAGPYDDSILVTARKTAQRLDDLPLAVDVIRRDKLDAILSGAPDVLALAGRSPSLYAESSSGRTFPRFYLRGLGNTDFDLNASQPVSLVYDEVVLENAILKGFPVF
ncbi:MAG: Plug domain-containing protein, partial [Gammaproteobacteria bacterium]|nr:Plug domain-containing protein [Gammaproteobacteria bacterium]